MQVESTRVARPGLYILAAIKRLLVQFLQEVAGKNRKPPASVGVNSEYRSETPPWRKY